jgi:hypothetical protein
MEPRQRADGSGQTLRTVVISPPSVRAETVNVLKATGAIVLIVAAYLFRPSFGDQPATFSGEPAIGLLPYQRLVRDAAPVDQRMFRELQEGLLEAERLRAVTGQWPDVATLAAEGIPPFAPDPTRKIAYKWTSVRQDWAINYLGVPADSSAPAWVLVILEPEPGAPADPAPNDETHHRLPDGTTLHVSIWNIPEAKRGSGFAALRLPQNEGWTNWLVGRYEAGN